MDGGEVIVNATTSGNQLRAAVALHDSGDAVVVWDGAGTGDSTGVFMQRYQAVPTLTFSTGDGTADATMTFTGTVAEVNAVLDGLTYTPNAGYVGSDTLTITTDDLGSTGSGGALSDSDTVAISVTVINDAPVVTSGPEFRSYKEDDPPIVVNPTLSVTDADSSLLTGATISITANYNGAQDVLAFTPQSGITGSWDAGTGTLTLSGSATVAQYEAALQSVTYENTSQAPTTSARTVEFVVSDGTSDSGPATKSVSIQSVFDRPDTDPVNASGVEDTASIAIMLSGSDVDGTVDYFQLASLPANGTLYLDAGLTQLAATGVDYSASSEQLTVYFVPDANWDGTADFQYLSKDDTGWTDDTPATATVTVTPVNDAPMAVADSFTVNEGSTTTLNLAANDTDADDGLDLTSIAIEVKSRPSSASVSFAARFRVVVLPSLTVKLSATAMGASLTGVTVTVAVAGVSSVQPVSSFDRYWKSAVPSQFASGTK